MGVVGVWHFAPALGRTFKATKTRDCPRSVGASNGEGEKLACGAMGIQLNSDSFSYGGC